MTKKTTRARGRSRASKNGARSPKTGATAKQETKDIGDETGSASSDRAKDVGAPLVEMVQGLDPEELQRRLLISRRLSEVGHRAVAFYLHDMQERGLHQLFGFRSAVHYAMERLELRRRMAQMFVAVGGALLRLQQVDRAFAQDELSWSKVRLLCRVATEDTEFAWVARAREVSCAELARLVRACFPGDVPPEPCAEGGLPRARFKVRAELGAIDYEIWQQARAKLQAERDTVVTDADLMVELGRMLLSTAEDGSIPGRKTVKESIFKVVVNAEERTVLTEDGPLPATTA
jgi:hypothetical protein